MPRWRLAGPSPKRWTPPARWWPRRAWRTAPRRAAESRTTLLEAVDAADTLRLDFSTLNDIDYYSGVVFKGYVRGMPQADAGGRGYDNLMRRFGKPPEPAVGFALYLSGWARAFAEKIDYDVDTLLLYDAGQSPGAGGAGGTEHFQKAAAA